MKKIGVLVVNLGTPDNPSRGAVYKYLKQFLLDPRVIDIGALARNALVRLIIAPFRSGSSAKLYKKLWTKEGSPLKINGIKLIEGLKNVMPENYHVELAMRYQSPSIEDGLSTLRKQNIDKLIIFPLFPHYASASTGSVHEAVMKEISTWQVIPEIQLVNSYPTWDKMIAIFVENAQPFHPKEYDHILFSYHGLPQRQMRKGDINNHCLQSPDCCKNLTDKNKFCYSAQCHATSSALADKLGITSEDYTISFQSRLGRDPWIQPYTTDILKKRRTIGNERILVFCPAFVSDCLETTIEISDEYKEDFIKMGGKVLDLVPSLNSNPKWVEAVKEYILNLN